MGFSWCHCRDYVLKTTFLEGCFFRILKEHNEYIKKMEEKEGVVDVRLCHRFSCLHDIVYLFYV